MIQGPRMLAYNESPKIYQQSSHPLMRHSSNIKASQNPEASVPLYNLPSFPTSISTSNNSSYYRHLPPKHIRDIINYSTPKMTNSASSPPADWKMRVPRWVCCQRYCRTPNEKDIENCYGCNHNKCPHCWWEKSGRQLGF